MEGRGSNGVCSAVCQHPSCWASHKHNKRLGTKGSAPTTAPSLHLKAATKIAEEDDDTEGDEHGLPTQKVVNLLDDYGEDPYDRYPSKYYGRPRHQRTKTVSALQRAQTGESVLRTRAPNATPASFLASTDKLNGGHKESCPLSFQNKPVGRVEVQEVFEPVDLASDWNYTFLPKKYFVWAPGKKCKGSKTQSKTEEALHNVRMKDMTEQMVPLDLEIERENLRPLSHTSPFLKQRPFRSPQSFCFDPEFVEPYPKERVVRKEKYSGVYELLDLPKDVLVQVMHHVNERDMLDPFRFAHALMEALPKLEQSSSSLALASSNVLRQKKVKLLDSKQKVHTKEFFPESQRMVMLDRDLSEQLSSQPLKEGASNKNLSKKRVLPSISAAKRDAAAKKPANIALGLPEVQRSAVGTKVKPFNYKKAADQDFTLGRVPSPSSTSLPLGQMEHSEFVDDHNSTLHVTMPTVCSDTQMDEAALKQSALAEYHELWDSSPVAPMHAVSPAMSTFVPMTPVVTPATRGNGGGFDLLNGTTPKTPAAMSPNSLSSTPYAHLDSAENIQGPLLHTIPETEHEQTPRGSIAHRSIQYDNPEASRKLSDSLKRENMAGESMLPPFSREVPLRMSPEVWPEVDEAHFEQSPEHQTENVSRESALQRMRQEVKPASPAPPPPSPDPQDDPRPPTINIDDLIESSSEFTLTVLPPSDLDDLSRITTPAETARVLAKASEVKHPLLDTEYSIVEENTHAENLSGQLDQFDATDESFKDELKQEYDKLSGDGQAE
ncbi:hypothetical protein CAPTEDRAFT_219503 [Capitella teleta]|uniref:Uncharacterized protein n=1 Tax=Capitella teleta TaxID=283909 RepID=X2APN5_CAPTE|nr:hypothetical protein CAPTEDRAFT_219503 [Capitella teleta]|eukprot:ELU10160.1 hypothetical protein CAPTEDRAFT_219503 [Capitella teleta]